MDGAGLSAKPGGQQRHVDVRPGSGVCLFGAGGAVRELVATAGGDPGRTDVPALLRGGRATGGDRTDDLYANRLRGVGWPGEQERHFDRGIRQAAAGSGRIALGGDPPGGEAAAATNSDD